MPDDPRKHPDYPRPGCDEPACGWPDPCDRCFDAACVEEEYRSRVGPSFGQSPDRAPTERHDPAADCWCEAGVDADRARDAATVEQLRAELAGEHLRGGAGLLDLGAARHLIGCGCPECPPPLAGDGLGASRR